MKTKEKFPAWQFNENQLAGANFGSRETVAAYDAIQATGNSVEAIRRVIGECDESFAAGLGVADLSQIGKKLQ